MKRTGFAALPVLAAFLFGATLLWNDGEMQETMPATEARPYVVASPTMPARPTPSPSRTPVDRETGGELRARGPIASPVAPVPKTKPSVKPRVSTPAKPKAIVISGYMQCGYYPDTAQRCIDKGLTLYHGNVLAGHNYMGYQWLGSVPVGRTVRVANGPMAGTYKVFGHTYVGRQGGNFPSTKGAALVLQTCKGSGTSFSLLNRI